MLEKPNDVVIVLLSSFVIILCIIWSFLIFDFHCIYFTIFDSYDVRSHLPTDRYAPEPLPFQLNDFIFDPLINDGDSIEACLSSFHG